MLNYIRHYHSQPYYSQFPLNVINYMLDVQPQCFCRSSSNCYGDLVEVIESESPGQTIENISSTGTFGNVKNKQTVLVGDTSYG